MVNPCIYVSALCLTDLRLVNNLLSCVCFVSPAVIMKVPEKQIQISQSVKNKWVIINSCLWDIICACYTTAAAKTCGLFVFDVCDADVHSPHLMSVQAQAQLGLVEM